MKVVNKARLKELRKARGMTQDQIAEAAGIPRSTFAAIEYGTSKRPGYQVISAIAKVLKVKADSLYLPTNVVSPTKDENHVPA